MTLDAEGRPSAPVIAAAAVDPYGPDADPADLAGADFAGAIDLAEAARALRAAAGDEYAHLVPGYDEEPEPVPVSTDDATDAASRVSRSHEAVYLPGGFVATTDMGLDIVRFWRATACRPCVRSAGRPAARQRTATHGVAPERPPLRRHRAELRGVRARGRYLRHVADRRRYIARRTGHLPGDTAAELAASRDGNFLYAGIRGSNTLATVRVKGAGDALSPVALVDAGVDWPRHHVVVRDTVVVAGQRSNEVASLTLDLRTGVPAEKVRHRVEAPSPTCLLGL